MFTVRSSRVVLPDGERAAAIYIDNGVIVRVAEVEQPFRAASDAGLKPCATTTLDFGDLVVSPGIIDTHVHINEPGRTEWEGFETATLSNINVGSLAASLDGQKPFTARLRLHGVTQEVTGRATLSSRGSSTRVDASFPLHISDYAIAAPRYLGVGVKNDITVRVVFTANTAP